MFKFRLKRGHDFKVKVFRAAGKGVLLLGGEDAGTGCAGLGPYRPDSGPGVHPFLTVACKLQWRPFFQGQGCLQVMSSRPRLIIGHVFKVSVDRKSCFKGEG